MQLSTQSLETEAGVTSSLLEDKYVDHWKRAKWGTQCRFHWFIEEKEGHHFLWFQHLCSPSNPDRTFGSVSVLIQRLWRMNQSALRTKTSADKPAFSIWVFYWRRATPFSTCWFSLNKSWPWWRLFTGSSEMFSSSSKVKTGRSKELWDLDSSVQWEVELWPHVKDLSSIKHWWWDTWSFT